MSHTARSREGQGLILLAACLALACKEIPTSLLVTVSNQDPGGRPDAVEVQVFDLLGLAFDRQELTVAPDEGARSALGEALGTIVVYPPRPEASPMRLHATGKRAGQAVSEGVLIAALRRGEQNRVTLPLRAGLLPDGDGDGVPAEIDDCPRAANPLQEDSDGDGLGDGCDTTAGPSEAGAPLTLQPNGTSCLAGAECESGFCVDGVCCDGECAGTCRSCALGGSVGRCSLVPAGQDPREVCPAEAKNTCGSDGACDGQGGCRMHATGSVCAAARCGSATELVLAATCDGKGACVPGQVQSCAPYACAGAACRTICEGDGDCMPGKPCVLGSCGLKPLGAACGVGPECDSGHCESGVCCAVPSCSGPCMACNVAGSAGSCLPVPTGAAAVGAGCAVEPPASCGSSGACDGRGSCQKHPAGTACGSSSCVDGSATPAPACDGQGTCVSAPPVSCGAYACKGDACGTRCQRDAQCATGYTCLGNTCRLRRP
jgi:hypothetical protein